MIHQHDGVILLHGIARSAASMATMERACARAGFATLNLDYPSRRLDLSALADDVAAAAAPWVDALDGQVHFITHSMGGLVARALLTRHRPKPLGRVVMLAPPNQGSEVADLFALTPPYRLVFGPAGAQLTTRRDAALEALLGPVDYELGIIAGDLSFDLASWWLLPKPNDGKVTVARTKLAGMADHITLPVTHTFLMNHPAVIAQTLAFLSDGRFRR